MLKFKDYKYDRPNLEVYKKQINDLLKKFEQSDNVTEAVEILKAIHRLQEQVSGMYTLASIRYSINTKDDFNKQENDFWNEYSPLFFEVDDSVNRAVMASSFLNELKLHFPKTYFLLLENKLKLFKSEIIPLLQQENQLVSEYDTLIASAQIDFDGKKNTLPQMTLYLTDANRDTRRQAEQAQSAFFKENEAQFDRIYDDLVKLRTKIAHELGFKDYVECGYVAMNRFDYNREMVDTYRNEILKHVVPMTKKLYERQAKRIGIEQLKSYDLSLKFINGNAKPVGTPEEILLNGQKMYHELSPETHEFIDFMMERDLFDVLSKDGKQAGGYCTYITTERSPFIFANFNSTSGDIDVLTHEAGHAFQVYQSRWISPELCIWPTYESCEIHSMSMEFFTWPWMHNFFKEQTDKYKFSHLASTVEFLPYGVLVDHFQHEVYENPNMTSQQRKETWRRLEKQYCPERIYENNEFLENGGFWFRQGHIFSTPFYYIDYTLAQICALQFWKRSQIDGDKHAWQDYLSICHIGGTDSFLEIVKRANLKSPFEEGALTDTLVDVAAYLNNVSDDKLI